MATRALVEMCIITLSVVYVQSHWVDIWFDDGTDGTQWTESSPQESWVYFDSDQDNGCNDGGCILLWAEEANPQSIYRTTNITIYSRLRLTYDATTYELEANDACEIHYAYDDIQDIQLAQSISSAVPYGDMHHYTNQNVSFSSAVSNNIIYISLETFNSGSRNKDLCFWDNMRFQGVLTTPNPTSSPTSMTIEPTMSPTVPSLRPTSVPTQSPTETTESPTFVPSHPPSSAPTPSPTFAPTHAPTNNPSVSPSVAPSDSPSSAPSNTPSSPPSVAPSDSPTSAPSNAPLSAPSLAPSRSPTLSPTPVPTPIDHEWIDDFVFNGVDGFGWSDDDTTNSNQYHGPYFRGNYWLSRWFHCNTYSTVTIEYTFLFCHSNDHGDITVFIDNIEMDVQKSYAFATRSNYSFSTGCARNWRQLRVVDIGGVVMHKHETFYVGFRIHSIHGNDGVGLSDVKVRCGAAISNSPTQEPSNPSLHPILNPTHNPNHPTSDPTHYHTISTNIDDTDRQSSDGSTVSPTTLAILYVLLGMAICGLFVMAGIMIKKAQCVYFKISSSYLTVSAEGIREVSMNNNPDHEGQLQIMEFESLPRIELAMESPDHEEDSDLDPPLPSSVIDSKIPLNITGNTRGENSVWDDANHEEDSDQTEEASTFSISEAEIQAISPGTPRHPKIKLPAHHTEEGIL
eukprot:324360_1